MDCLLSGDIKEAIRNLEQAVVNFTDDDLLFEVYRSICDIARRHSIKSEYDRAIDIYSKVLTSNRELTHASSVRHHIVSDAYKWRGLAYVEKGEVSRGIDDYDKLRELFNPSYDPHNLNAFIADSFTARAYESIGEYDRAIEIYDRFLEREPDCENYIAKGDAHLAKGEFSRAIENFDKAIKIEPYFSEPYMKKANAYYDRGEYPIAIENYDRAIEILRSQEMDPDYPDDGAELDYFDVHYRRGMAHYNNSDYRSALADVGIALHYDACNVDARILRDAASAHLG